VENLLLGERNGKKTGKPFCIAAKNAEEINKKHGQFNNMV
jgi:hypothetical protein